MYGVCTFYYRALQGRILSAGSNPESLSVFSTGNMSALAPVILKNRLLAPEIFGHFSTVGIELRVLNKNHINI